MRKRKDTKVEEQPQVDDTLQSREKGVEITEIEDNTVLSTTNDESTDQRDIYTTQKTITTDVDKQIIRKKKKQHPTDKISEEVIVKKDTEYEEEIQEESEYLKTTKSLKTKKPQINDEELSLEEIEDLEIIQDSTIPSLLINIPSQQNEIISTNQVIDQAPDKPQNEKATITVDTVVALTEEYHPSEEKETHEVNVDKPKLRKASLSVTSVESYSTTETMVQDKTELLTDASRPHSAEAVTGVIPSEGIIISETNSTEAKLTDLEVRRKDSAGTAKVTVTLKEATTVSEMTTNEKEITSENYKQPNEVQAETLIIPQQSLTVFEIQEGLKEDRLTEIKPVEAKPKIKLNEIECLQVEEVHTADKPTKYYPELIVPTEIATSSVIEQKQRFTQELLVSEKEGEYIPDKLPTSQKAEIEITCGGEAATTREQLIQESESMYHPDRKLDSYVATPNIKPFEGIEVSRIDSECKETELKINELKKFNAEINLEENFPVFTSETTTAEKENIYHPDDKPEMKSAEKIIIPLELGVVMNTMIQESEGIYTGSSRPSAAKAETNVRPEEYINVSEIETAEYPAEYNETIKFTTETGNIAIETSEAKIVQETLTHEQENILKDQIKPEERYTRLMLDERKGLEIVQYTLAEKEGDYNIYEMPESHKGKTVPTHTMTSCQISEMQLAENISPIAEDMHDKLTAKLTSNDLEGMLVNEVVPIENVIPAVEEILPESKKAEIMITEADSIHTTEVVAIEKESEYNSSLEIKEFKATPNYSTQIVASQEFVRTESPTDDLLPEKIIEKNIIPYQIPLESITVSIQQSAEKEDKYQEDIKPTEKVAVLELTEARLGATTLEVITSDREQLDVSVDIQPQDVKANLNVSPYTVAIKSETLTEQNTSEIRAEIPVSSIALPRQEAFEELLITETNVAETEKPKEKDKLPTSQRADMEFTTSENLTVNQLITVLNKVCIQHFNPICYLQTFHI